MKIRHADSVLVRNLGRKRPFGRLRCRRENVKDIVCVCVWVCVCVCGLDSCGLGYEPVVVFVDTEINLGFYKRWGISCLLLTSEGGLHVS
jgi:hypothetical protein